MTLGTPASESLCDGCYFYVGTSYRYFSGSAPCLVLMYYFELTGTAANNTNRTFYNQRVSSCYAKAATKVAT